MSEFLQIVLLQENRLIELVVFSVVVGAFFVMVGYAIRSAIAASNRPALTATLALRKALINVREHALDVVPDEQLSNAALSDLRRVTNDLDRFPRYRQLVNELMDAVESYMMRVTPGYFAIGSSDDIANIYDRALQGVDHLMDATAWAAGREIG